MASKKRQPDPNSNGESEPVLTEAQRLALEKQQEQARALHRLEAEFDLLSRQT